jgi:NDP-sugar pyrophosphorylase family protein
LKTAILAGGAGTRLYPLTEYVPKALIPLGGRYIIEYVIEYLKGHGIHDLVMLVSKEDHVLFQNHLGNGERFGVSVEYSVAERIGTAGALGTAGDMLGDRFTVYYADVLTDLDLSAMIKFHADKKAVCTIAMTTTTPIEYGVARVAEDNRVSYFEEKPVLKEYPVNMGILVCEKQVLAYCKPNTDLSKDVIPRLVQKRERVFAYLTESRHYDIGTFKSLEEVRKLAEQPSGPFSH